MIKNEDIKYYIVKSLYIGFIPLLLILLAAWFFCCIKNLTEIKNGIEFLFRHIAKRESLKTVRTDGGFKALIPVRHAVLQYLSAR